MKKLLSVLLAIMLLLSATPVFAESETATTGSGTVEDPWFVYSWSALKEKMALGGNIKLGEDVLDTVKNDSSILTVPSGVTATLDLNGFEVNKNLTSKQKQGYVISVGGTLNIADGSAEQTGKITGGYTTTSSVSGIYTGGGLCVMGGTLNLYGGSICNNRCTDNGGGVFVNGNGAFNMYGGKIESNYSSYEGGGVAVYAGSFILEDGEISKNIANSFGGGVSVVKSGCTFVMNGGLLSENFSYHNGGGVGGQGTFTMNGGTITLNYTKNDHYGGGVYVGNDFKFYLNGGSIIGNYTEYNSNNTLELGGGVAVWGTGFFVKGSPVIKDNYCLNTRTDVSTANDVDVQPAYGNWNINLTGALEDGALIGVSAHGTGQVTSGFNTYHENDEPSKFFFADQQGYKPYKNANGEVEIKSKPKYTVSFNANGGTGTIDPVEVYEGEEYTLPSNTFKKEGRSAYGWKVGDEYKSKTGDIITVTADTEVTAVYAQTKTVNLVKDRSTTTVTGSLKLTDTRTGEVYTKVPFDEVTSSAFTAPSNPTVNAMIEEAKAALLDEAKAKAGAYALTVKKDEVSDPNITDTVTTTTPKFVFPFDPSLTDEYPSVDANGDLFIYNFLEGELSHHWRYDVTLEAEFSSEESEPTPEPVLTPEEAAMPTEEKTEELIKKTNTDKKDVAGSDYQRLMLKATPKGKTITLKWKAISGANGYIIYGAPCGQKMTRLATVTNPKTVKKTFKKLKKGKYYKYMVVAYKKAGDGSNRIMTKSKSVHCTTPGGKKGNPTGLKAPKKLTVKKGKKFKIKAKLLKKGKVATHIAKFRYETSNKAIATVDAKGYIKGKKKGTVKIYVYTQNGICKTIKVKVK